MDVLARGLVMASQYVADIETDNPDADIALLESLAELLQQATEAEKQALFDAAKALGLPDWPDHMGLET